MITEKELRNWGEAEITPELRESWESLLLEIDARISLTATEYKTLSSHYDAVSAILENPKHPLLGEFLLFVQGSFGTKTVIRPPGRDDVDLDAIAYAIGGTTLSPMDFLQYLYEELEARVRTGGSVTPSKRCVVIDYSNQEVPCHMDVTPAERRPGNEKDDGSGLLRVPDQPSKWWSPSNPKDFSAWFEQIAQMELNVLVPESYRRRFLAKGGAEPLPSHEEIKAPNGLRVAVRLMKRHRDVYVDRTGRKKTKPISVIITTLAARAYERIALRSRTAPYSPMEIIAEVVSEMRNCFSTPRSGEKYRVENPQDPSENFAEKWNDNEQLAATFFSWLRELQQALRYGYIQFPTRERFRSELVAAFGTSSGAVADEFFAEITNDVYPGLSEAAANRARLAGKSAAIVGLGSEEPTQPARPKPLKRLG